MYNVASRTVFSIAFAFASFIAIGANNPPSAVLSAHYECLWWSPEQMEGLDPNHPPKKQTVTRLQVWEYSDPVGVPHPDEVTFVAELPPTVMGNISVKIQWLEGRWSSATELKTFSINPGDDGMRLLSAQIPVALEINTKHPSRLRSVILADGKKVKTLDLPIQPGD
jgi:hypothetical protein